MRAILLQYMLIIFLVIGIGYVFYLIKDKSIELHNDYFGFNYSILNTLKSDECNRSNIKTILKIIGEVVKYIEIEYFNEPNDKKEDEAVKLVYELVKEAGFESPIDDISIRYLIRISVAMLPSKQEFREFREDKKNNK
ncbi:hypothetical protein HAHI6034_04665 [Hathewaya histolytica]|uniref:Uncharacterized protein n=1 Tax=Hathewaya histolytica TaxID=1498 RepID=A0A4U9R9I2_HATHI|nr:hypothetical protein [Hathewaya histolytica]VTQ87411.1 Uncharacterised protein [Hathewaya histolytica]